MPINYSERYQKHATWAAEHLAPFAAGHDQANTFNHKAWNSLATSGFWDEWVVNAGDPEAWMDFLECMEGIASTALDSGFILSIIAQAAFIRGVEIHAECGHKEEILDLLRKGTICATGIAEPQSGTDAMASQSVIESWEGGWKITGEKTNIAHAPTAGILLLTGKVEPDLKLGAICVTGEPVGLHRLPSDEKMGMRTIPTGTLKMDAVEGRLVGAQGEGRKVLNTIGLFARASYGIGLSALARPVLQEAMQWLHGRHSLGIPLLQHQYLQHHLTEASIHLQSMHSLSKDAVSQVLRGSPESLRMASTAKIVAAAGFVKAMDHLLAVQGSAGYQQGATERLMRDALGWRNVGGTEEMHRLILAQTMMAGLK